MFGMFLENSAASKIGQYFPAKESCIDLENSGITRKGVDPKLCFGLSGLGPLGRSG